MPRPKGEHDEIGRSTGWESRGVGLAPPWLLFVLTGKSLASSLSKRNEVDIL